MNAKLDQRGSAFLEEENVKEFNELREKNPDWRPNLMGADLEGKNLTGVNFYEADLRRANLSKTNFTKAKLSKTDFREANLDEADFREVNTSWAVGLPTF